MGAGRIAIGGGASLVVALIAMLLGVNPFSGDSNDTGPGVGGSGARTSPQEEQLKQFSSVILADTEDTWPALLAPYHVQYVDPHLVLFTDAVESGCGYGEAAMGPFYCPRDERVYLDLSFFNELASKLGAPGDFAQAYVIAHEVGHHVQNLLGISDKVERASARAGRASANSLSVQLELQADCYAGIWAHHAQQQRHVLDPGDIEEGLNAASQIGDDTLQRKARGYVVPETFTHGTSAQRVSWFKRGFESGKLESCDTFATSAR